MKVLLNSFCLNGHNYQFILNIATLFLQVHGCGNTAAICLKHDHLVKVFSLHVIHVLTEQSDKTIPVSKFVAVYEKLYNHKLRAQNFGFASLEELLCAMPSVVKVSGTFQLFC